MPRLTRRRLFAAGGTGAAATVLAACGASEAESERSEAADGEILLAAAVAEARLGSVARQARGDLPGAQAQTVALVAESSGRRTEELTPVLGEAGVEVPAAREAAGSLEGLADAAQEAVGAYREGAALLSTVELRNVMFEHVAQVGAELAAARDLLGEEPSPFAFVTGGSAKPHEDTDFDPTADE